MVNKRKPYCRDSSWIGRSNCKSCSVRNSVLFAGLSDEVLDGIVEPIDNYIYEAGAKIYDATEEPQYIYTLRSGLVKLEQSTDDGVDRIVRLPLMGDVIGMEALVGEAYQHTAVTLRRVDLCRIPVSVMESLQRNYPNLSEQISRHWEDSLQTADYWITRLSTGTARQRAAWLVRYLLRAGNSMPECVELLSTADMAAAIGTTVETLSRTVAEMKERGVLEHIADRCYRCDFKAIVSQSENIAVA